MRSAAGGLAAQGVAWPPTDSNEPRTRCRLRSGHPKGASGRRQPRNDFGPARPLVAARTSNPGNEAVSPGSTRSGGVAAWPIQAFSLRPWQRAEERAGSTSRYPEDSVAGPGPFAGCECAGQRAGWRRESGPNGLGMRSNEGLMTAGRWKCQDDMDVPTTRRILKSVPLCVQLPDDFLEAPEPRFDLHQYHVSSALESDVYRAPSRSGYRSFHGRSPSSVARSDKPLDDPSVGGIEQHWRSLGIEVEPEVGAEAGAGPGSSGEADAPIASLEPADDRSIDPDSPGDGRLRHAYPKAKLAEVVREAPSRPPQLPITGPNGFLPERHVHSLRAGGPVLSIAQQIGLIGPSTSVAQAPGDRAVRQIRRVRCPPDNNKAADHLGGTRPES